MGKGQAWPAGVVAGFDGGKPDFSYSEACCGVEVLDEGANAGQVVGIEGRGGSGPLGGNGWMVFGAEREASTSGTASLTPAGEEDGVIFGKDGYSVCFKEHFLAMVAELAPGVADRYVWK